MKITLDIYDNKMGNHLLALLKSLSYVKIESIIDKKSNLLKDIKSAVDEVNEIKAGKKKGKKFDDFLNEL